MKRRGVLPGVLMVLLAGALGVVVGLAARQQPVSAPGQQVPTEQAGFSSAAPKPRYRLSSYEGKLAVYIIGKQEPELVFDRYLHHLPDVDRLRLEEGIEVAQYTELLVLIEDYTS